MTGQYCIPENGAISAFEHFHILVQYPYKIAYAVPFIHPAFKSQKK